MKYLQHLLPIFALFTLSACDQTSNITAQQQTGANPKLPAAQSFLMPPTQVPKGVGWKDEQTPEVASGLKIERIAAHLQHPRQLYVLPNGDILVVEANDPGTEATTAPKQVVASLVQNKSGKGKKGGNRITLLRPTAEGGYESYPFLKGLNSPFGVQLIGNRLFVANTSEIKVYAYDTGATSIDEEGKYFTDLPDTINHHWTKSLLASPDGRKLYVGVGSNSNITENGLEVEYRRAAVLEVDSETGASRIYASGLRNPTGLDWEPQTGKLWAIVNERDEIGANLVPDYLTAVQEGGFYGWPYSYFGQHVDDRVRPQRPELVKKAIKPDYALSSHVAPLGMTFSRNARALPAAFQQGVFIAEHGSWNRSPLNGYKVVFIRFENGQPVGQPQPVVTGFVSDDQKQLRGAPVGLAIDKSGALLIADDVGNSVWRVSLTAP